jgi:hypothetical protein
MMADSLLQEFYHDAFFNLLSEPESSPFYYQQQMLNFEGQEWSKPCHF